MAAWFFTEEEVETNKYIITGENAKHIKVLRMKRYMIQVWDISQMWG